MSDAQTRPVEIGLVLQGGGALGAYEWGAVTALLELMDDATDAGHAIKLKCVTGVSIGAINAACTVGATSRADARGRLAALWNDLTLQTPRFWSRLRLDLSAFGLGSIDPPRDLSLFGLPGFYVPRADLVNFPSWTAYYDTSELIATLRRHVNFAALNASETRLVITAVDVISGELTRFRNHPVTDDEQAKKSAAAPRKDEPAAIEPRHILASGSLPPQFPWTEIGGHLYWDGGIVDNSPLGDAIDAFTPGDDVDRILVVMNLYPLHGRKPRNLAEVSDRAHELQFGNRLRQDRETAERINALLATIEELAALAPPGAIDPSLQRRLDNTRRYKILGDIVMIDMQDPGVGPVAAPQDPADDESGLRDFSAATVEHRRARGYALASARLVPLFHGRGLVAGMPLQRSA